MSRILSCISVAFPAVHIQGGIKVKYILFKKRKVMVTRKMVRNIAFNGHETTEVS